MKKLERSPAHRPGATWADYTPSHELDDQARALDGAEVRQAMADYAEYLSLLFSHEAGPECCGCHLFGALACPDCPKRPGFGAKRTIAA